ncbi:hypothetical protein ACO0OL_000494 [Hanseniaspora opuntiae]
MVLSEEAENELIAIETIYPENIEVQNNGRIIYSVLNYSDWRIHVSLNFKYPETEKPNILMIDYVGSEKAYKNNQDAFKILQKKCDDVLDNIYSGAECLFEFFSELSEYWNDYLEELDEMFIERVTQEISDLDLHSSLQNIDPFEGWIVSVPIEDRGSTFISYAYGTKSPDEAFRKLDLLKTDNKIARSRHIMTAYRFVDEKSGNIISDCDDDGETAAGSRMLHLLTLMDAKNVFVACARWFTGTHIGPDRFKHINSATRDAVIKGGFSSKEEEKKTSNNKKKK